MIDKTIKIEMTVDIKCLNQIEYDKMINEFNTKFLYDLYDINYDYDANLLYEFYPMDYEIIESGI